MNPENGKERNGEIKGGSSEGTSFTKALMEKMKELMKVDFSKKKL